MRLKPVVAALLLAGLAVPSFAHMPAERKTDDSLHATAYLGWAFDTFASHSIGDYPPGTVTTTKSRTLFGVDFDCRLAGDESGKRGKRQFRLSGETPHGFRSSCLRGCTRGQACPFVAQHDVIREVSGA
jgi:hypothetical protein